MENECARPEALRREGKPRVWIITGKQPRIKLSEIRRFEAEGMTTRLTDGQMALVEKMHAGKKAKAEEEG